MTLNGLILVLRLTAAALLYLFLLGAVFVMWRDWRAAVQQAERSQVSAARSPGRLIVVEGGETDLLPGQSFPLSVITGLGRATTNTVIIDDTFASSEHALLTLRNGRWWLEDLRSMNGTRLNGERIKSPAIVATGDEVGIGAVRLRIELEGT